MTDQAVQRSPEVQQMLSPYGDLVSAVLATAGVGAG